MSLNSQAIDIIVAKNVDFDPGVPVTPGVHVDGHGIAIDSFNFGISLSIELLMATMVDFKDNETTLSALTSAVTELKTMKFNPAK